MSREVIIYGNELYHHGVKGQKWGVRRYQNEDGTLTEEGKKRYMYTSSGSVKKKSIFSSENQRIDFAVRGTNKKDAIKEVDSIYKNENKKEQEFGLDLLSTYVKNNPDYHTHNSLHSEMVKRIENDFDYRVIAKEAAEGYAVNKPSKSTDNAWKNLKLATSKTNEMQRKIWSGEATVEQLVDAMVDHVTAQNKYFYARMGDLGIDKTATNLDSIRWIIGANHKRQK